MPQHSIQPSQTLCIYFQYFWKANSYKYENIFIFTGFGDAVNNSECWNPVIKYVEDQYDDFLDSESKVERFPITDSRVHVCLYFIAPTGHCLKPLDIEFMKRIHEKVRVVQKFVWKKNLLTRCEMNFVKLDHLISHLLFSLDFLNFSGLLQMCSNILIVDRKQNEIE